MTAKIALQRLRQRDRTALALGSLLVGILGVLFHLAPTPAFPHQDHHVTFRAEYLHAEHGLYESAGITMLLGAAVAAVALAPLVTDTPSRAILLWLGSIALIAAVRELDLHILLSPEYLGRYGVRYRIDWWLDHDVSILRKFLWAAAFGIAGAWLILPPLVFRAYTFPAARNLRDTSVQMLILTALFWGAGAAIDDLLRGAGSETVKRTIEEAVETIGALCFLLAATGYAAVPISRRFSAP